MVSPTRWRVYARAFVVSLLFLVIGSASRAQQLPVLGYVAAKNANPERLRVFQKGLHELGYVEGKNIAILYRDAVLDDEYAVVVAELIERRVAIILAANVAAARAATKATTTIPIVLLAVNDPVGTGLVKSLEHPGPNVTGTTMYAPQLIGERLKILKRVLPHLQKIAVVLNQNNPNNLTQLDAIRSDARAVGVEVKPLDIRAPQDVDPALEQAAAWGAQAVVNAVDSFVNSQRYALASAARRYKLPAMYTDPEYVEAGGLMAFGPGHYEGYYGAARYVDRILRGADPRDLPIAGATQFTFTISRRALNELNVRLPDDVSARVNDWRD